MEDVAAKNKIKQPVLMRINLDVGAETHPMVLTSGYDQQFGISIDVADKALKEIYDSIPYFFWTACSYRKSNKRP
ncbi:MAG: hypothetical protein CM15mP96_3470 [Gammaproteobacteria bacterium]|nr:MAG: hypothetical protein CM15mP96_3470 [Gammaproteobacteria bacterium]